EYDFNAIKKQMDELGASCCVPSFLGKDMKNVLTLGEKKSGDYYTSEDLNVLFTLAQESAIAIENARLYDEAIKKTHELERINEALEAAKSRLTDALKETETANKQLQDTQVQLIHEQKMATLGRLAASVGHEVNNPLTILSMNVSRATLKYRKNPDLKVSEILEVFQKMEQNISRIKAVVNTLTGLLKKSEKGKFEPLSLKLILEETLPLVQFQTYLDNLAGTEVEFNISGNVPLIRGDLERLQEVFLNLFINAYHAMAGRRNPHIKVTAEVCPEDTKFVVVNFTDNGSGMSEETMKKIFNYGYTTKPPGKGSGMGLYMCKYIIELHGGEIKVKSKLGLGTCFSLTLPVYEETKLSDVEAQAKTG
ncbi:MAG: ATP-binding protein, partial [Candidatus Omnitrophica bacterium]|nr:ATP-binding protein [Candidatus Omnitrophota bacterium]